AGKSGVFKGGGWTTVEGGVCWLLILFEVACSKSSYSFLWAKENIDDTETNTNTNTNTNQGFIFIFKSL
ncbi:hypothetical protein QVD17_40523, partial [Tagetes erecta]